MLDRTAQVERRATGAVYGTNSHLLANDATLLWDLSWTDVGSTWSPDQVSPAPSVPGSAEVTAGRADVYQVRLSSGPRYSRLFADGTVETADYTGFDAGHRYPELDAAPAPFRYYALTVSVGRFTAATERYTVEIQQWQPIIEAPPPATLNPLTTIGAVYGRQALPGNGEALLQLVLSKDLRRRSRRPWAVWAQPVVTTRSSGTWRCGPGVGRGHRSPAMDPVPHPVVPDTVGGSPPCVATTITSRRNGARRRSRRRTPSRGTTRDAPWSRCPRSSSPDG